MLSPVHFLLRKRLLDVASELVDHVALLQNALIHGIVVIKGNKGKSAGLVRCLVGDNLNLCNGSKLGEIFGEHLIGVSLTYTTHVQSLAGDLGLASVGGLTRDGALRINLLVIDSVRAGLHGLVNLVLPGEGDKSESSASLRGSIFHNNTIRDSSKLFIESLHGGLISDSSETTHEDLPELLRLLSIDNGSFLLILDHPDY